ncbi:hypothetical protein [Cypionkella sp.]|uniref:hypothetical protein n=1 Tax=Cypionkella sp. TaxID=2811411 RepID=UPI002638DC29|nr:hypothetical protein [Cypionkella sp.]MDB5663553.1 hypothetical protein [Cypionkella sp.]
MTCEIEDSQFILGPWFEGTPQPSQIALEAGASGADAINMVEVAWAMISTYTRRQWCPVLSGEVLVHVKGMALFRWPRWPEPAAVETQMLVSGEWKPCDAHYIKGVGVELDGSGYYRLAQVGTVPAPEIPAHVFAAVQNLATYLLVQGPARREFKTQGAGDANFSRESMMGALYGSGAGAMIASEVRL